MPPITKLQGSCSILNSADLRHIAPTGHDFGNKVRSPLLNRDYWAPCRDVHRVDHKFGGMIQLRLPCSYLGKREVDHHKRTTPWRVGLADIGQREVHIMLYFLCNPQ